MDRKEMEAEAEGLGIDVDGRWSDETLQKHIDQALASSPAEESVEEKPATRSVPVDASDRPLHELNREQRKINDELKEEQDEMIRAATGAIETTLAGRNRHGRRVRKNLRPAG